jgi:endonuclease/exonuclease/phosphatase family metal-dependent hydrolase
MTYNIHHGEGLDQKVDLERIVSLIQQEKADIVALQEVDKGTQRTSRRDFPAEMARLSGMTCVFSNNYSFQGGQYGNAILTRFEVLQVTNTHLRMLGTGEPRGLLQVLLRIDNREVVFMDTHLDAGRQDSERLASAEQITELLRQYERNPIIICGDFNDPPGSRTFRKLEPVLQDSWSLVGKGDGFTIPAERPNKRIDYIWVSKGAAIEPLRIWVPKSEASDHLPVVAELRFKSRP